MILVPVKLKLPSDVQVIDYRIYTPVYGYPTIKIQFNTPIFRGEIETKTYADGKEIEITEGVLTGSYKYSSPLEWVWNNFEFYFENLKELAQIFQQILSGKALLEEARYRKNPPEDLPPNFANGYGPKVYEDVLKAYRQLFSCSQLAQKTQESVLTVGG